MGCKLKMCLYKSLLVCTVFIEFLQSYTPSLFGFVTAWQRETSDINISCKRVCPVVWTASWFVPQFHKFQHQPWKDRRPTLKFLHISNKLSCCYCSRLEMHDIYDKSEHCPLTQRFDPFLSTWTVPSMAGCYNTCLCNWGLLAPSDFHDCTRLLRIFKLSPPWRSLKINTCQETRTEESCRQLNWERVV